jgi:hypothetical protein
LHPGIDTHESLGLPAIAAADDAKLALLGHNMAHERHDGYDRTRQGSMIEFQKEVFQ